MITKIEFENYRVFKKRQTLEIKPITIVFGKNNAGKSAVLKLPELLCSIVNSEDVNNFSLNNDKESKRVRLANEYRDLIYGRGLKSASFVFSGDNTKEFSFHVDGGNPLIDRNEFYEGEGSEKKGTFVDYIGPFRNIPPLDIRIDTSISKVSGLKGDNMIQALLRSERDETGSTLLTAVSKWYKDNFEGWGVEVRGSNGIYQVGMSYDGNMFTPICDCGTGIAQSLPIIIRANVKCDNPTLVVMEEPESHLNPAAHANMCQLLAESAQGDENKRYLIETHSHTFILRLQRMLVEHKLTVDDVALYLTEFNEEEQSSILKPIEITADGRIPNWPKGMFEDDVKEIIEMHNRTQHE